MEHTLGPASIPVRGQLEHRAATVGAAAAERRAVEITGCVEGQVSEGISSVAEVKRMEYALAPASISVRRELENRAISVGAALVRRAVEIPGCVEDQATKGSPPSLPLNEWSTLSAQLPSPFGVSSKTMPSPWALPPPSCRRDSRLRRRSGQRRGHLPSLSLNEWRTLSVQIPSPFGVSWKTVPTAPQAPPLPVVP